MKDRTYLNLRFYLLLFSLFTLLQTQAQLEASIWYFGRNAGLDFRSGAPVPLLDGQVNTLEGCAAMSDSSGNILFYTDGITVWNRNHTIMPNGTDLAGHPSATNAGIIVPAPGQPALFYVFSAGAIEDNSLGIRYSTVDLGLDGGLGDVTTKNTPLVVPATEKLTAVKHANGTDFWVVAHDDGDGFYAYLVTAAGISAPVVTNIGLDLSPFPWFTNSSAGAMKFSPDGTKACIIHRNHHAALFDFNPGTGQFSNERILFTNPSNDFYSFNFFYATEFSPSGKYVYASFYDGSMYQFDTDLAAPVAVEILAEDPDDFKYMGQMQLAIDGKIYVARSFVHQLSVINNPDAAGTACDFQLDAVDLGGRESSLGLPPFIQSFFFLGDIQATHFCLGDATEFSIDVSEPITSISWDFGDGNTSTLETPTHVYATPGVYTVSVVIQTATETNTEVKNITIYEVPVANPTGPIEGCTSYGSYNLDMPSFDATFLGAQDPATFEVSYHPTQADADADTNPFTGVHSFAYGVTAVYVRVANRFNPLCYDTTQFDVVARQAPLVDVVSNWAVCDDDSDGLYAFDLTQKDAEIFNGQDQGLFDLRYFASQADADADTNPLPIPYTNTLAVEELFFRFQNSTYTHCYRTGSFMIEVTSGVVANTPADMDYCDDDNDGQVLVDLTQFDAEVIGTQNPAALAITYHSTQTDADAGTNAIPPTAYLTTGYESTIYIRVAHSGNASCYDTTEVRLSVFDTPTAPTLETLSVCDDDNDGSYTFDLNETTATILNGTTTMAVRYFASDADAQAGQNQLPLPFTNTSNPQQLFFRLEHTGNTACFDVGTLTLAVYDTPTAHRPDDIVRCDVDETGRYDIDLTQQAGSILNGQDPQTYLVTYHQSELEALNNENPIGPGYVNSALRETLFARVTHVALEHCYDLTPFDIIINPLPRPEVEATYVICPDSPDLVIDAGPFEAYEWRDANGILVETGRQLAVAELGAYTVTVFETTNGRQCSNTASFEVRSSGAPEGMEVHTSGISDTVTLTVSAYGVGDFEYSINGVDYQTDSSFEVFPGSYTVYVRDPLECRILTQEVIALGYPKFFSPNGDGTNENWNIIGGELHPGAQLFIFDRYGKLLRQISPLGVGWDGTYLGQAMPASDYWFRYTYDDGKVFAGHFALKR